MRPQQLIENNLNKHSGKQANKSTLVAGGAETQLRSQRISAYSLATNVDLWKPIGINIVI